MVKLNGRWARKCDFYLSCNKTVLSLFNLEVGVQHIYIKFVSVLTSLFLDRFQANLYTYVWTISQLSLKIKFYIKNLELCPKYMLKGVKMFFPTSNKVPQQIQTIFIHRLYISNLNSIIFHEEFQE